MNKLQNYLACLIAPVLLFQALALQAQQATVTPLSIEKCDYLSPQTMGVDVRLNLYSDLFYGRQCVVLSANPAENLNQLIKQIPEKTVILLSSETVSPPATTSSPVTTSPPITTSAPVTTTVPPVNTTTSVNMTSSPVAQPNSTTATTLPSVSPVPGKVKVEYLIDDVIRLKNGQDIIGAADDGSEIVIRDRPGSSTRYMVRFGDTDSFRFRERRDSSIRHVTFQPTRENNHPLIDTIVFAECYNRRLILDDNVFHIPLQAAVRLDCKKTLNKSGLYRRRGPSLSFTNNTVIGKTYSIHNDRFRSDIIPNQGLLVNLPFIRLLPQLITVTGNTFRGSMAEAAAFKIGPKVSMDIFKNKVKIDNEGATRLFPYLRGGFVLEGTEDIKQRYPLFYLVGNQIKTTENAITVRGAIALSLTCNHFEGAKPWWQPDGQFGVTVFYTTYSNRIKQALCGDGGAVPGATPTTVNTWTAISGSTATACTGLKNLEGEFVFDTETCLSVSPFSNFMTGDNAFLNSDNISSAAVINTSTTGTATSKITTTSKTTSTSKSTSTGTSLNTNTARLTSPNVQPSVGPTSSAGADAVTTALGVMTTLALLANLQ
ncbi:hypothetical protein [Endozoicomonas sp. 4G]|uniref:hypothetical protein n=1 Tax=Endozoicomonas sp. 4G TaxID=2872754 RepID=UPI002078598A|nr:hypothetical protein [Endozoicomonas sp. 4G]